MKKPVTTGEKTRQKLIEAGLCLFGARGFDGVGTRELARKADVNQGAIVYHFGSKESLYLAVAELVVEQLRPALEQALGDAQQHHAQSATDQAQARIDLQTIVVTLLRDRLVRSANPEQHGLAAFILREELHPTQAFEILYDGLLGPLHQIGCQLLATIRNSTPDNPAVVTEVQTLFGQANIFTAHRSTFLRSMGTDELDAAQIDQIVEGVGAILARQLA